MSYVVFSKEATAKDTARTRQKFLVYAQILPTRKKWFFVP